MPCIFCAPAKRNNSAKGIINSAMADGGEGENYETTFGNYCDTMNNAASVVGDIYCSSHNTLSTGYMDYGEEEWKEALNDNFDENGSIKQKSELSDFISLGTERWSTVGVESADVCDKYWTIHEEDASLNAWIHNISQWFGIAKICGGVNDGIAIGSAYTRSSENDSVGQVNLFSGYVLFDKVDALLEDGTSKVSAYKEKYYKEHPLDNSEAGIIARRSGMTKQEAEVALAYADYLNFIARYNPAERYAFGVNLIVETPRESLVDYANKVAVDLYVMWHGKTEYEDLRNRTQIV